MGAFCNVFLGIIVFLLKELIPEDSFYYTNISSKLYEHMRHEILNEEKKLDVYKDILLFYDEFQHTTSYSQV